MKMFNSENQLTFQTNKDILWSYDLSWRKNMAPVSVQCTVFGPSCSVGSVTSDLSY